MGNFLAATAIRDRPDAVAAAVEAFLAEHSAVAAEESERGAEEVEATEGTEGTATTAITEGTAGIASESASVFAAGDEWSVVIWPAFFNVYDEPAAGRLSETCDTLVSTVHTFGDDYWTHVLYDRGTQVDVFCSKPTYHLDGGADEAPLREALAGRPDLIAEAFGVDTDRVAAYLKHTDVDKPPAGAAADGDEHDLADTWVFTDFWRALGIAYPGDQHDPAARVTLAAGWQGLLPVGSVP